MERESIVITSTFTAEPVAEFLNYWNDQLKREATVNFAPYHQLFQELLDPNSLTSKNRSGVNVLLVRFEDWAQHGVDAAGDLGSKVDEFISVLTSATHTSHTPHLLVLCPPSSAVRNDASRAAQAAELEQRVITELKTVSNIQTISWSELSDAYPVQNCDDANAERLGKIPYTREFFCALGTLLSRKIYALRQPRFKVIVLDCDQTLWKGVCAETGPAGVEIDAPRIALQNFVVEQCDGGMLICLVSKNNEADVNAVFEYHSAMPLKSSHIVARRINWLPKSRNIQALAEELQLGLDSFIFIDDNPIECSEVEASLPGVLTLCLPADPCDIPRFLNHIWSLSKQKITAEDSKRTLHYQRDVQRERERGKATTFSDFIARLELKVAISPLQNMAEPIARVAQLTQRTNQFNATTIRRTEAELRSLCGSAGYECHVVEARDRFGDYGLVGAMIFKARAEALNVDTILLSCRALGRGIEHRMVAALGKLALERGLACVEIQFIPTERNEPARLFLRGISQAKLIANGKGFTCSIPAQLAAELSFNGTIDSAQGTPESNPPALGPSSTKRADSTIIRAIATELFSVEKIIPAVDIWKRRTRPDLATPFVAPRNDAEHKVAGAWRDVLGIESIGVNDNFFELGGNSILGTLLINRISSELSLHMLLEAQTIAEMATRLEARPARRSSAEEFPLIAPDPSRRYEPFPMTDTQQAYWIGRSTSIEFGGIGCHLYEEVDVEGLDIYRFKTALRKLVARHDMLRAVVNQDGTQRILASVPDIQVETYDLRGADAETTGAHLESVRRAMSHQLLPSDKAPMLEFRATILDGGRVRLHRSTDRLISDALSDKILIGDLYALYTNPHAELPKLELSFRDYVLGEAELLKSEHFARSQQYWRKRIPALPPAPELPIIRSAHGATVKSRFERRLAKIEREQWQRFQRNAAAAGVTPAVGLLAAYAEVLAVWSKSPRFSLNLTTFNRFPLHPQVNEVIGDGTSVDILAIESSREDSFAERAVKMQAQLWLDLDHRHFSGVKVLRELMRAGGGTPRAIMPVVFTSTLNLESLLSKAASWSAFGKSVFGITQTAQVWLDNQVYDRDGALGIHWDAVEDLFPHGMLSDMFEAYIGLVRQLADDPQTWKKRELQLVPQHQLEARIEVNATESTIPAGLIHQPFLEQAARQPGKPAVIAADRTLTYGELRNCAVSLGRQLREKGAPPNTIVAVVMEKGWEQVLGVLGVLQSGAAYLPIDPEMPRERLAYVLENAQVRFVVTTERVAARVDWPANVERIVVDAADAQVQAEPLEAVQSPTDLAYVIYTSGSTGRPKGVMIDHRGALNTIADINQRFSIGPNDRTLALSSLSFDLSVYDIFGLLAAGGAIVFPDAAKAKDPAHWLDCVRRERVTLWNTVPTLMEMLANHALIIGEQLPSELRTIMLSGDWIPLSLPPKIKSLAPRAHVFSLGGATEASIWSILYPLNEIDPAWPSVPYGKPMKNQTFHVLDHALQPCPVWAPGFLYIGGIGLAKGYLGDAEKTAASFIHHPRTGERLYRTGDMGRYLPDGNIEFLGRVDHQVKIRGYRIELGEIEAALAQHPAVREAVVAAREDAPGEKRLVAYLATHGENVPTTADWRGFLREKLPDYMIPAAFVQLDKIPLSSNGKVDRRALPAPDQSRPDLKEDYTAPRNSAEEALANIWAEVLTLQRVGIHDNFFDLGGDSIMATQALTRANKHFGVELNLFNLFEQPTVAALTEILTRARIESFDPDDLAKILGEVEGVPSSAE